MYDKNYSIQNAQLLLLIMVRLRRWISQSSAALKVLTFTRVSFTCAVRASTCLELRGAKLVFDVFFMAILFNGSLLLVGLLCCGNGGNGQAHHQQQEKIELHGLIVQKLCLRWLMVLARRCMSQSSAALKTFGFAMGSFTTVVSCCNSSWLRKLVAMFEFFFMAYFFICFIVEFLFSACFYRFAYFDNTKIR